MAEDEQRLLEEARRSREETEKLREEAAEEEAGDAGSQAKTRSGDADSVTEEE